LPTIGAAGNAQKCSSAERRRHKSDLGLWKERKRVGDRINEGRISSISYISYYWLSNR
jgi:hypothetical protein